MKSIISKGYVAIAFEQSVVVVHTLSFKVELYQGDELQLVVNERSMLHHEEGNANMVEHGATSKISDQNRHGDKTVVDYGEDGMGYYLIMNESVLAHRFA